MSVELAPGAAVGRRGDLLHGLRLRGACAGPGSLLGRHGARGRGAQFAGGDAVKTRGG